MRLSKPLLIGALVIGVLLLGVLGATLAWGATGGMRPTSGAPGMMGSGGQGSQGPGMMGTPGHGGMGGPGSQPSPWPTHGPGMGHTQVEIHEYAYHPMMLRVPRGTTITWTNEDDVPHSVTFRNGMADSGLLKEGQTFQYTFKSAGTYQYYCSVHPYMHGTVTVTP